VGGVERDVDEPRLADARLAGDDRQATAPSHAAHDVLERGALLFTTDERRLALAGAQDPFLQRNGIRTARFSAGERQRRH
jgi:hypothetical protein